jgi:uncharacterized repeat protein (TIGR03803 family)
MDAMTACKARPRLAAAWLMLAVWLAAAPCQAAALKTLARFDLANGANPSGAVTIVPNGTSLPAGTLLGTATAGGPANRGTVFAVVPPTGAGGRWSLQTLYSFSGQYDLATPTSSVTLLSGGGMAVPASGGGPYWLGGVDTLTPQTPTASRPRGAASAANLGRFLACLEFFSTKLDVSPDKLPKDIKQHCVTVSADSAPLDLVGNGARRAAAVETGSPAGVPLPDGAGGLYVAVSSSSPGAGAVLHQTPPATVNHVWPQTVLYVFGQSSSDLSTPSGTLIAGASGELYGAALFGGAYNKGGIYRLTPPAQAGRTWKEDIIWSFGGAGDGIYPSGDLLLGPGGVITGITPAGGSAGFGAVFQLAPPASGQTIWQETVLYSFFTVEGVYDGMTPEGGLYSDSAGNLYGTTRDGGAHFDGTVFKLTKPKGRATDWRETILWSFTGGADGAVPLGKLVADAAGYLYGTTSLGGLAGAAQDHALAVGCCGYGTVFKLRP